MVVLEPVPSISEESSRPNVKPKPSMASSDSVKVPVSSSDGKATAAGGYASDGFETASDSEINDEETGATTNTNQNDSVRDQPPVVMLPTKDHPFEDALNDDELNQKTLAQVNDAKVEGNKLFVDGKYDEALLKYDLALQLAPELPSFVEVRSICHANRATCFSKLLPLLNETKVKLLSSEGCLLKVKAALCKEAVDVNGKYEDAVKESSKALELNPTYMKALLRRGEAHEKLEHYDEAIADMTKIVELDPSNHQARRTAVRLEPLAREKREKMKEEMLGKLKDVGNSILGRFGMSVDNFKAVQDPNTGSYSISFQR